MTVPRRGDRVSQGFSLVELLVCVATVGVLISLLASGIQSAREAARRVQCRSRLRELTLAVQLFHDTNDKLPPLEIADSWATWAVFILPEVEQASLYNKWQLNRRYYIQPRASGVDLPVFHCPSRGTWALGPEGTRGVFADGLFSGPPGWSDYGAAAGTSVRRNNGTFATAIDITTNLPSTQPGSGTSQMVQTVHPGWRLPLGLKDHSLDGISNTIMLGEMHVPPTRVLDSVYNGDNPSGYQRLLGHDGPLNPITGHYAAEFALVDQPMFAGVNWSNRFGSPHTGLCHFSLADGSARAFSVSTDLEVLDRLSRRGDGQIISQ